MTAETVPIVVLTGLLVLVTLWYATETRRMVSRLDRQQETVTRPVLTFQLIPWHAKVLKLRIENVGAGPAFDVQGTVEAFTSDGPDTFPWSYPLLGSGRYEEFGIPAPANASSQERFNLDAIRARVSALRAAFTYRSAAHRPYTLDTTINVTNVTQDWVDSQMMATEDHPDRLLPRIAKALEDIAKK